MGHTLYKQSCATIKALFVLYDNDDGFDKWCCLEDAYNVCKSLTELQKKSNWYDLNLLTHTNNLFYTSKKALKYKSKISVWNI